MLFHDEEEEKKKKPIEPVEFYADTMEEETKRGSIEFMNKNKSAFESSTANGINKSRGVFDSTAIFHVDN